MGRAPCCEKMGLKKGPWTPEEDKILVAHIQSFGHSNWRALPKQAGLLRCGKSCRLRWINYLRPDIKRGNFSKEEEDAIITLHQQLGNRWSAIAARLPGRTDNEIKNVWHTHLKKRLDPTEEEAHAAPQAAGAGKKHRSAAPKRGGAAKKAKTADAAAVVPATATTAAPVSSPERSSVTETESSSSMTTEQEQGNTAGSSPAGGFLPKEESQSFTSSSEEAEEFQFDESFWSETLSMPLESFDVPMEPADAFGDVAAAGAGSSSSVGADGDLDYWLGVFMENGDAHHELPQI